MSAPTKHIEHMWLIVRQQFPEHSEEVLATARSFFFAGAMAYHDIARRIAEAGSKEYSTQIVREIRAEMDDFERENITRQSLWQAKP